MPSTLDLFRLDGLTAVVTGASSGLGAGFARALADAGASLVLVARRQERLKALAEELTERGTHVSAIPADVSIPDECERAASAVVDEHGRLDILINNAGVGSSGSALRESVSDFRHVIDVNLNSVFWMARACAARMDSGGSIVNVSSVLGQVAPRFPQASYAASKAGVIGLTRDLAHEWTETRGIRVNALCPGYFESEMTAEASEVLTDMVVQHSMIKRFGTQAELDGALLFLASPASTYVTGTTLTVDGGLTAY